MKRNNKLSIALHVLGHMAAKPEKTFTSEEMAAMAMTNPVVIRRTLGHLKSGGLLTSERGKAGGWRLAKSPQSISVTDVYQALDEKLYVGSKKGVENPPTCAIEIGLAGAIAEGMERAEREFQKSLKSTSIADLVKRGRRD